MWVVTGVQGLNYRQSKKFQSTPPMWVVTPVSTDWIVIYKIFQSTPPMWVVTRLHCSLSPGELISIHTTHVGGDSAVCIILNTMTISIHTTHVGGDTLRLSV